MKNVNRDIMSELQRILDYARLGQRVADLPNCNDCGRADCGFRPEYGDNVRINCHAWVEIKKVPIR